MMLFHCVLICVLLTASQNSVVTALPTDSDDGLDNSSTTARVSPEILNDSSTVRADCSPCKRNGTVSWPQLPPPPRDNHLDQAHVRNVMLHGMMCTCNVGLPPTPVRDDYRYMPGIGSHKLHTRATVWNVARKLCNEEGGHLAIVNSIAEAHILMDIFNRSGPVKGAPYPDAAFVGIHDLYAEGDWVTVLDDSLAKTGYTGWSDKWGGQPDNGGGRQNCGAFMKEGGLDDVACDVPFPFFCELPLMHVL